MCKEVKNPEHYTQGKIEVRDFIVDQKMGYLDGQVVRYIARHRHKGEPIKDLKKAREYLDVLIAEEEREPERKKPSNLKYRCPACKLMLGPVEYHDGETEITKLCSCGATCKVVLENYGDIEHWCERCQQNHGKICTRPGEVTPRPSKRPL